MTHSPRIFFPEPSPSFGTLEEDAFGVQGAYFPKLYAWQPDGHGPQSFFVVAASEQEARAAVTADIKRRRALPPSSPCHLNDYSIGGWPANFDLTVADPGTVISNDNE